MDVAGDSAQRASASLTAVRVVHDVHLTRAQELLADHQAANGLDGAAACFCVLVSARQPSVNGQQQPTFVCNAPALRMTCMSLSLCRQEVSLRQLAARCCCAPKASHRRRRLAQQTSDGTGAPFLEAQRCSSH